MLEMLVVLADVGPYAKGDILVAKPAGAPWGRRELRPAAGKSRLLGIVNVNDAALETRMQGKPLAEPYRDGEERSTRRVNVDGLSTTIKNRLANRKQTGRIGNVTLQNKVR